MFNRRDAKKPLRYCVTGASSGVGLGIVKVLAARHHQVTGFGRRAPGDLPPDFPDIAYHQVDLATATAPMIASAATAQRLILAAGTGFYRPIEAEDEPALAHLLATNFTSTVKILHQALPRSAGPERPRCPYRLDSGDRFGRHARL
ncbi:hypothetical protein PSQ19_11520 [Devosia algicola]|uniref:SDR family NAD(P)-dependent oxidoreductase n=1 Tax=Devosia algicola TaxID=3026418 RepID=A0ABY7YK07_9HYPH|nr:hypothetical protein [Devosia algicola]WDR01435.1 hypothetical protein PSQ19_11520 [Devosia algicola]